MTEFVVVGAGLGGALAATLLAEAGHRVVVLERRKDSRAGAAEAGRSINLAISTRGLHALEKIGLREEILRLATPLSGRMIHPVSGSTAFQPYGARGQAIHSIPRLALNHSLLTAAEAAGKLEILFGRRCVDLDLARGGVISVASESGGDERFHSGVVLGADGAYSAVRAQLQMREGQDYSQAYLSHGYKELHIPAAAGGAPRLDRHALHIWPRGGYMMMAMANPDASFTVTLYLAHRGPDSFEQLHTREAVRAFFGRSFPDAVPLLPGLDQDFAANPTGTLVTVRCRPWHLGGKVALLGDACHAIVPFFGQGANAAFEDCLSLAAHLAGSAGDCARAFAGYEAERRPNADAIADLALANFHEMRDKVASPLFRFEKRAEVLLHRLFPKRFIPLYTMISFTTIPYAEARERARRQRRALRAIGAGFLLAILLLIFLLLRQ